MLKIGLIGTGHLGKIHLKLLQEIESYDVVGFYDSDEKVANAVEDEFKIKAYADMDALIADVDVIDIVTPTIFHHVCAVKALKESKHVFIEKPVTNTLEEAQDLIALKNEANVKVQIGHIERFNPALLAINDTEINPMFIEAHRLAQFNPRGIDVSVVGDLMIHDIDVVLSLVKSNVKKVSANGVAILSDNVDIANARIEFDNGCVANLTASRISLNNMRKMRLFQKNAYISLDFLDKKAEVISISDDNEGGKAIPINLGNGKQKNISVNKINVEPVNAIKLELEKFAEAILNNTEPLVTLEEGYDALNVAFQIVEKIDKNNLI